MSNTLPFLLPEGCHLLLNEPMAKHTTFKIGGCADYFFTVNTEEALNKLLVLLKEQNIPFFLLGNGSNLLVSDEGIRGAVIMLDGEFKQIKREENKLICGAAASLTAVCIEAKNLGLSGLEFAYGIPGTVGGAVYMNAGAYGGEMKDVLLSSRHIAANGEIGEYQKDELELSYRKSRYTKEGGVILSAVLSLHEGSAEEIDAAMKDFMGRRKSKQPLEYPSAGSVFKRPEGYFAGALIENSGLKGASVGGAQVSEKHAGFIVNKGGATCEDVRNLIALIQEKVKKDTGVDLECEVKFVK